jgi:hypothetical protein
MQNHKIEGCSRLAWQVNPFCAAVGISRSSFYGLVKRGEINTVVIAGRRLVPDSEARRLLAYEAQSETAVDVAQPEMAIDNNGHVTSRNPPDSSRGAPSDPAAAALSAIAPQATHKNCRHSTPTTRVGPKKPNGARRPKPPLS